VAGPQQQPIDITTERFGLCLAPSGDAASYLVLFSHRPLAPSGLQDLKDLQLAIAYAAAAGLEDASIDYVGLGVLGAEFVTTARTDMIRAGIAAGLVNLVLLMVLVRAVVARVTLATSFAFVGLIPVAPFQELAFAVAIRVLIDTLLVRSLLVPGLIVLVSRASGWPGGGREPVLAKSGHGSD
jgi:hypothetical protein